MDDGKSPRYNINVLTGELMFASTSTGKQEIRHGNPSEETDEFSKIIPSLPADMPSSSKELVEKLAPVGKAKNKDIVEKNSEEYIRRRQRNNAAVRKSREKTRERSVYTQQKVEQLKIENEQLESKIATLSKELSVLKDLFMDHARGFCGSGNSIHLSPTQIEQLLGCKTMQKGSGTTVYSSGASASINVSTPGEFSAIQPLINAAEIELMGLKSHNGNENMKICDVARTDSISEEGVLLGNS